MTTAEILLQDYDAEIAGTRRVLERIPEDLPDFKCHDKSMPLFDAAAADARAALAGLSDADLATPWTFSFGDHVISNAPRSLSYRQFFFNHLLHHRAQLSVYLRLNDIPVPGLYGPSADEPFNPTAK